MLVSLKYLQLGFVIQFIVK